MGCLGGWESGRGDRGGGGGRGGGSRGGGSSGSGGGIRTMIAVVEMAVVVAVEL